MSQRRKKAAAGKFLPQTTTPQGQPSHKRPFIFNQDINNKILAEQGMAAAVAKPEKGEEKGLFVKFDVEDHLQDVDEGDKGKMGDLLTKAVKAAVDAAIPAMVKAVKEVCLSAMKEEVNPHLLRMQYKHDELAQQLRRDNLRITGVNEEEEKAEEEGKQGAEKEESEEMLHAKVIQVAGKAGVTITREDLSACHRVGRRVEGKVRQILVLFSLRRKRDDVYAGRFKLKDDSSMEGVYVNEDLTPMRIAVLKAAKASPLVKRVNSSYGNIVCKMTNNEFKTIASPDDLFDVGINSIDYNTFKLHFMA